MGDKNKYELETHFILRLPEEDAKIVSEHMLTKPAILNKNFRIDVDIDNRKGLVILYRKVIPMILVDLPTVVESLKTTDNVLFHKVAFVTQMLVPEDDKSFRHMTTYRYPHGLTPPLKNVRRRRFRKILKNPIPDDYSDIAKELKWLFQMDSEAVSVKYEVIETPRKESNYKNDYYNLFGESDTDDSD